MDVFSNYAMYTIIVPDYPIGTGLFLLGGIGVTAAVGTTSKRQNLRPKEMVKNVGKASLLGALRVYALSFCGRQRK